MTPAQTTTHPAWCEPKRCDVNSIDPLHATPAANVHLGWADLEVAVSGIRIDEHNVHTGKPTGLLYGTEVTVPVDETAVVAGMLRIQLSDHDLDVLVDVLRERQLASAKLREVDAL